MDLVDEMTQLRQDLERMTEEFERFLNERQAPDDPSGTVRV